MKYAVQGTRRSGASSTFACRCAPRQPCSEKTLPRQAEQGSLQQSRRGAGGDRCANSRDTAKGKGTGMGAGRGMDKSTGRRRGRGTDNSTGMRTGRRTGTGRNREGLHLVHCLCMGSGIPPPRLVWHTWVNGA